MTTVKRPWLRLEGPALVMFAGFVSCADTPDHDTEEQSAVWGASPGVLGQSCEPNQMILDLMRDPELQCACSTDPHGLTCNDLCPAQPETQCSPLEGLACRGTVTVEKEGGLCPLRFVSLPGESTPCIGLWPLVCQSDSECPQGTRPRDRPEEGTREEARGAGALGLSQKEAVGT